MPSYTKIRKQVQPGATVYGVFRAGSQAKSVAYYTRREEAEREASRLNTQSRDFVVIPVRIPEDAGPNAAYTFSRFGE